MNFKIPLTCTVKIILKAQTGPEFCSQVKADRVLIVHGNTCDLGEFVVKGEKGFLQELARTKECVAQLCGAITP